MASPRIQRLFSRGLLSGALLALAGNPLLAPPVDAQGYSTDQPPSGQQGTQPGMQGTQPGMQPGYQQGTQPGTQPGYQQGTQPGVQPEYPQGTQPGMQPEYPQGTQPGERQMQQGEPGGQAAQQETGPEHTTSERVQALNVTAGKIASSPEKYYGRTVKVTSKVEDVFSRNAFTLDEDRLFAGPDVLILVPSMKSEPSEKKKVTVVGVVRPYVQTEIEREYAWFDPGQLKRVDIDFSTRPVIVAQSVKTQEGQELVTTKPQREAAATPHKDPAGRSVALTAIAGSMQPAVIPGSMQPASQVRLTAYADRTSDTERLGRLSSSSMEARLSGDGSFLNLAQETPQGQMQPMPQEQPQTMPEAQQPSETMGPREPIRDLDTITGAADPRLLEGKRAELSSVPVQKVLGDRAFLVGQEGSTVAVLLAQPHTTADTDIKAGDTVKLTGTIRKTPDDLSNLGIQGDEAEAFRDYPYYLYATEASTSGSTVQPES